MGWVGWETGNQAVGIAVLLYSWLLNGRQVTTSIYFPVSLHLFVLCARYQNIYFIRG